MRSGVLFVRKENWEVGAKRQVYHRVRSWCAGTLWRPQYRLSPVCVSDRLPERVSDHQFGLRNQHCSAVQERLVNAGPCAAEQLIQGLASAADPLGRTGPLLDQ